jgi:putative SOS response-associated peptidase YedK
MKKSIGGVGAAEGVRLKDPESGEWLRTCTIITGEPNELIAQIHPRMPVILPQATSRGLVR